MPGPPAPSCHHRPPTKTVCRFAEKCHNVYCQYQHPAVSMLTNVLNVCSIRYKF